MIGFSSLAAGPPRPRTYAGPRVAAGAAVFLRELNHACDDRAVGGVLDRLHALIERVRFRDDRLRVDLSFFNQLHVARDITHHVQPALLSWMNRAAEERERRAGERH